MTTAPRLQSEKVPGLVMWPNGAIVRVELDKDGKIIRNREGRATVLSSYGRVQCDKVELEDGVFRLVEEMLERDARPVDGPYRAPVAQHRWDHEAASPPNNGETQGCACGLMRQWSGARWIYAEEKRASRTHNFGDAKERECTLR